MAITITMAQTFPENIIETTVEGEILKSVFTHELEGDAFHLYADEEEPSFFERSRDDWNAIVERLKNSPSQLMNAAAVALENEVENSDDDNVEINISDVGLDWPTLLRSLCEQFPEELPCVEVMYGYSDYKPRHGDHGGGAYFITAESIDHLHPESWLANKRREFDIKNEQSSSPKM